jgi:TIR domain
MAYQYDIFISYRRDEETLAWIKAHLVPLIRTHVGNALGRAPTLYLDVDEESPGAAWPAKLGDALGRSRIVLVLWSKRYLNSVWCAAELSQMIDRQTAAGLGTITSPVSLIVPAIIHDGEPKDRPAGLAHLQWMQIDKFFTTRMAANGGRAEEFELAIKGNADHIADCIIAAPAWSPAWGQTAATALMNQLQADSAGPQTALPRFTG